MLGAAYLDTARQSADDISDNKVVSRHTSKGCLYCLTAELTTCCYIKESRAGHGRKGERGGGGGGGGGGREVWVLTILAI